MRELISLSARGLKAMYDPDRQLFCHRLLCTEHGLVREGVSPRYTIMALLGLRELALMGTNAPFDIQSIYISLIRNTSWIRTIGDFGLLIWLIASFEPDRLGGLLNAFDCQSALDRYPDAQESRTMELAWFLAGLAHAAETCPKLFGSLTDLCVEAYHRMEDNQSDYGLFGHMSSTKSLAGRIRGRIGSFADQVYAIYAMSKFATVFHVEDPLCRALECADSIRSAQGELGQWWWLYDARSGCVSSHYPVYSVHQHGIAPMALFALEQASGQSFKESIYKGLRWICGGNELDVDMRDRARNLIWRCVLPRNRQRKYWEIALSVVRSTNWDVQADSLKVLCEQRPFEFGWLLFGFCKYAQTKPLFANA